MKGTSGEWLCQFRLIPISRLLFIVIEGFGNAVIDGLEAKGFKLNEQEMQDIFREVAKEMNAQQDTQDK